MPADIDLHTHSYFSDGTLSPRQVIELAARKKIRVIALTDHDCIEGIAEAQQAAAEHRVQLLPGIEISARYQDGKTLHILGLGLDLRHPEFVKAYQRVRQSREAGMEKIIARLNEQGVVITRDMLLPYRSCRYLDRYAVLRYFMANRLCTEPQAVWDNYLDKIPYGEAELWTVEGALQAIKAAGGLSFLAHYTKRIGLAGYSSDELKQHMRYLKEKGLDGLERFYPSFSPDETAHADELIAEFDLLPSGGTDFHGANRSGIDLGSGDGNFAVPYSVYETIQTALNSRKTAGTDFAHREDI